MTLPHEILKHKPEDFGGWQRHRLSEEDLAERLCATSGCFGAGRMQIRSMGGYRIVCGVCAVNLILSAYMLLGHPSPASEAEHIADQLGLPWPVAPHVVHPCDPKEFRCSLCGGAMVVETVGMYKGKRFIHTCLES